MTDLAGKNIVLGVTGGIAAYKAAELCRMLIKDGATVRVVMTEAATKFITPLTLQTLSGAPVALNLFDADEEARIGHIRLGDEADAIVVAPATANSISSFAAGAADDLLSAVILASGCPVLLAPAMNVNMWRNPLTQNNLARLLAVERFQTVGPDAGELACGWVGEGRLIEPLEIVAALHRLLLASSPSAGVRAALAGLRVVVTAGPTFEPIDDVRFLGNRSSGKMGFAIAESAARRGAEVTLIAGPVALPTPRGHGITRLNVETAAEMGAALHAAASSADVVVMAAAVADFRPATRAAGKLSRRDSSAAANAAANAAGSTDTLALLANPDLLAEMGRAPRSGTLASRRPFLVGFAAEVNADGAELVKRALQKLQEKNCDVIVANDVGATGVGFGSDDNAVTIVYSDGMTESLPRAPKLEIAAALWDRLAQRLPGAIGGIPAAPLAPGPGPGPVRAADIGSGSGSGVGGRRG